MSEREYSASKLIFSSVLRGLLVSLILLLVGSLLVGIIVNFTNIANLSFNKILFLINYLSIFIGGIVAAYSAKGRGWLNGGLVGLIYMLIIILLGSIWNPIIFSFSLLSRVMIGCLVSAVGGMIGVNVI